MKVVANMTLRMKPVFGHCHPPFKTAACQLALLYSPEILVVFVWVFNAIFRYRLTSTQ